MMHTYKLMMKVKTHDIELLDLTKPVMKRDHVHPKAYDEENGTTCISVSRMTRH
jgi:hypothetical protein